MGFPCGMNHNEQSPYGCTSFVICKDILFRNDLVDHLCESRDGNLSKAVNLQRMSTPAVTTNELTSACRMISSISSLPIFSPRLVSNCGAGQSGNGRDVAYVIKVCNTDSLSTILVEHLQ